jgi:hypothetical protein
MAFISSGCYIRLITKLRNLFYDYHIFKAIKVPVPVVAVGILPRWELAKHRL